jgi:hypothetical protein
MESMHAMKTILSVCFTVTALLVSCDETKRSASPGDASESGPRAPHAKREGSTATARKAKHRKALEAALKIESPDDRDQALAAVVRDALEVAPDISAEAFKHLSPASAGKQALLQSCAKQLIGKSPEAALAWADSLGEARDVLSAKAQAIRLLGESDPARAVKLLSGAGFEIGKPPGSFIATTTVRRWAAKSPADAAAWAIGLPPDGSRKVAIRAAVSEWIKNDSPATLAWMAGIDDDALRQEASHAVAENLVRTPPSMREAMLESAAPALRGELERQVEEISKTHQLPILPVPVVPTLPPRSSE